MCRFASVPFCISFLQLTLDRAKERVQAELKKFRQAAIRGGSNGSISIALVVPTLCHPGPSCLDMVQWCCRKSMAAGQDDALAVRDLLRPTSTCAHSFWVISVDQEYDGGRLGFQGADETLYMKYLWNLMNLTWICDNLWGFVWFLRVGWGCWGHHHQCLVQSRAGTWPLTLQISMVEQLSI